MNKFTSLVTIQLRDKLDMAWTRQTKSIIQKIVFFLIKFIITGGAVFAALLIFESLGVITKSTAIPLYLVFFVVLNILNIISASNGLMKSLYYAEDNKVLVTLPVSSSQLFISKLLVYYIFEIKKALDILIPVTLGFFVYATMVSQINPIVFAWMWVPILLICAFNVLLGSILSIPFLYAYKFIKKNPITELILLILLVAAVITISVLLIKRIPENIDLINEWYSMLWNFEKFIKGPFTKIFYPLTFMAFAMTGEIHSDINGTSYVLTSKTFINASIILGATIVLATIVYFAIKPFYFNMMTKTFEFNKNIYDEGKKNKKHQKYVTFANKELILSFRDIEISGSYLTIYILAPILLFFLDTLFSAISTRLEGDFMTYGFNILLILLPYLSSNSILATLYSKEGRAAYIKKTKPIDPLFPLISKILFNLVFSIPSIIACSIVFGNFAGIGVFAPIAVGLSVLLIQYGHIFYSASLDIMNPQNELYATEGDMMNNPNELKSTVVGFIISAIVGVIMFLLLRETYNNRGSFDLAFVKLVAIAIAYSGAMILLFVMKVKAYYYEK